MIGWLLLGYNFIVFLMYGWDKLRARKGWWRIPESTLLWLAAAFGGPGAWLAMRTFHHKTHKPRFAWGVPLMTLAQAMVAGWVWWKLTH